MKVCISRTGERQPEGSITGLPSPVPPQRIAPPKGKKNPAVTPDLDLFFKASAVHRRRLRILFSPTPYIHLLLLRREIGYEVSVAFPCGFSWGCFFLRAVFFFFFWVLSFLRSGTSHLLPARCPSDLALRSDLLSELITTAHLRRFRFFLFCFAVYLF